MRAMRSAVALVVLVCFSTWSMAASIQVTRVSGAVTAQPPGAAEQRLKVGDVVAPGSVVSTGQSSTVVLRFDDGQVVALKSLTRFSVDSYRYDPKNPSTGEMIMSLFAGGMRAITGLVGNSNRSAYALKTPVATIGIRGTDFLAALSQGLYTQTNSGAIGITNAQGTSAFASSEISFTAAGAAPTGIPASALPAGLFTELQGIVVGGAGAAAGGAAQGAAVGGVTTTAVGAAAAIAIGVGAAAAAASGSSSTTHH